MQPDPRAADRLRATGRRRRARAMTDLILIAATLAFFAASAMYLRACTKL